MFDPCTIHLLDPWADIWSVGCKLAFLLWCTRSYIFLRMWLRRELVSRQDYWLEAISIATAASRSPQNTSCMHPGDENFWLFNVERCGDTWTGLRIQGLETCVFVSKKCRSQYRLCPYEHLNWLAGRDRGTACDPLHRPSRSKKKAVVFSDFFKTS